MAQKNMELLLGNILGDTAIQQQDIKDDNPPETISEDRSKDVRRRNVDRTSNEVSWRHFSFTCSKELVDKVQAIAHKEGFTIRTFMEYVIRQGIETYEAKHGKVKKNKSKNINEVM